MKTTNICGDVLTVSRVGGMWVSPTNGRQHPRAADAMRAELRAYLSASGEDVDSDEMAEMIEGYISAMNDA